MNTIGRLLLVLIIMTVAAIVVGDLPGDVIKPDLLSALLMAICMAFIAFGGPTLGGK